MNTNLTSLNDYGHSFQIKSIVCLLKDKIFLKQMYEIITPDYYDNDANKWIVFTLKEHFFSFKELMTLEIFKIKVQAIQNDILKVTVIDQLREVYKNFNVDNLEYVKEEFKKFCVDQHYSKALMEAVTLLGEHKHEQIRKLINDAAKIGVDPGNQLVYKDEVDYRYDETVRHTVPTPWDIINKIIGGGLGKCELGVVIAPSGVGKSWYLAAIGICAVKAGLNVIHFTLELSKEYTAQRYDSLLTGINPQNLKYHIDDIKLAMENLPGILNIFRFPAKRTTVTTLASAIDNVIITSGRPNLIIVDYGDILKSSAMYKNMEKRQMLAEVYEELRDLSDEYEAPVWTASQTNRGALEEDIIEGGKIAEAYEKIWIADFILSIQRKTADKISDTGKVHIIKNRFGPDGMTFPAKIALLSGKFEILDDKSVDGNEQKQKMLRGDNVIKEHLRRKYVRFGEEQAGGKVGETDDKV
jgi:archaellum biogenesis ATPase FlaH